MRDGTAVSATLVDDISKAASDLESFIEASKGTNEELQKWRRDKFDSTFAKYIHKYFINQKSKGRVYLEEAAYKDLHFMTNKYLELLGSVEFNTYMQTVINKNLGLQNNTHFQALLVDLMVNSVDFNSQGKTRAIALEKFVFLLLQLALQIICSLNRFVSCLVFLLLHGDPHALAVMAMEGIALDDLRVEVLAAKYVMKALHHRAGTGPGRAGDGDDRVFD
jgi:hypothetical protein